MKFLIIVLDPVKGPTFYMSINNANMLTVPEPVNGNNFKLIVNGCELHLSLPLYSVYRDDKHTSGIFWHSKIAYENN